jgi:hypothetical protein
VPAIEWAITPWWTLINHAVKPKREKHEPDDQKPEKDAVEAVVKHMHIVLPIVGAVLIFMLATIAVVMACRLNNLCQLVLDYKYLFNTNQGIYSWTDIKN